MVVHVLSIYEISKFDTMKILYGGCKNHISRIFIEESNAISQSDTVHKANKVASVIALENLSN